MKERLKKIYNKKQLCCFYYDENDTETFLIGWIISMDEEFFIIECINMGGYSNGFVCRLIDSVIKVESCNKYLQSIEKLFNLNKQKRSNKFYDAKNCLKEIIDYVVKNRKVAFVELCESSRIDSVGYIKAYKENDEITILTINDIGELDDGEVYLDYERISAITIDSEYQVRLEKIQKNV